MTDKLVQVLTLGFLASWVFIGVACLFYGVVLTDPSEATENVKSIYNALNTYGTAWLGMAVSSVLVLFGVNR